MDFKAILPFFAFSATRPAWQRYGCAFLAVVLALIARESLNPLLGRTMLPFIFFFPAVAAVAVYGGIGPALLAVVLSGVLADYFEFIPLYTLMFTKLDLERLAAFVVSCLFIVASIQVMHGSTRFAQSELARRIEAEARIAADLKATTRLWEVANRCGRAEFRLEDCLEEILNAAIGITGADKGNIQLFHAESGELKIATHRGFDRPFLDFFANVREKDACVCGTAMHGTTRTIVEDVDRSKIFAGQPSLPILQAAGVRAVISTPLVSSAGKLMGMLSVHFARRHTPNERELQFLDLLTHEAADYFERRQADALHAANALLTNQTVELEHLVSERTSKLQEMVDELQHVSYAIVHDMRAPLRAMNMFAEGILEQISGDSKSSPQVRDYCQRIIKAGERLDQLIQDALSYTGAVLKESPLHAVELTQLISDLVESYPNLSPAKADIMIEKPLPVVVGHESLLTQCFSNLLGNAVKFVAPGVRPKIRVRSERRDGFVRIAVADNGIGIPPEAQHRLFGMFERLTADYEGSGIGLAIVRKVVERMNGKVGVDSESGKGSCFWVELQSAADANVDREHKETSVSSVRLSTP